MFSVLVAPPNEEPVSLAEAKAHLRILDNADDAYIEGLITVARQDAENHTKRAFVTQTWRASMNGFPDGMIFLPRPPLIEAVSVLYMNDAGDDVEVTGVSINKHPAAPFIRPGYGLEWPIARDDEGSVTIEYTAGYGSAADVPAPIKHAILLLVGHYFENREESVLGSTVETLPRGVNSLLAHYRVVRAA